MPKKRTRRSRWKTDEDRPVPYVFQHPAPPEARNARGARRVAVAELPPELQSLLHKFAVTIGTPKSWQTFCRCGDTTSLFLTFLLERGYSDVEGVSFRGWRHAAFQRSLFGFIADTQDEPPRLVTEYPEFFGSPSEKHAKGPQDHYVARLGETWYVDWTARQYNPRAPYPLVWIESPERPVDEPNRQMQLPY